MQPSKDFWKDTLSVMCQRLLQELAAKAKQAGHPSANADRAMTMAKDLVIIPNPGGYRSLDILPDPPQVGYEQADWQVGNTIITLMSVHVPWRARTAQPAKAASDY